MSKAVVGSKLSGGGEFSRLCEAWLEKNFGCRKALLTPSCTASLELAALLINISDGDEVIIPSYTFVSTANAFVMRGGKVIFVDVSAKTMNIDSGIIESAITEKTKAIVPVHYAGVSCNMDRIMSIAERYGVYVIEDAAQGVMGKYRGQALGTIGHIGCYSFHDTKNYTSGGEGGAILINDAGFLDRAEILREKGTNRSQFMRGEVDKYTWRDVGSSYLPGELQAAFLYAQLESAHEINNRRLEIWDRYHASFLSLESAGVLERPFVPEECEHNAHMYYIKLKSTMARDKFIEVMKGMDIQVVSHYVPLHSSPAGLKFGKFFGKDNFTTLESGRMVRLPLWFNMSNQDVDRVIAASVEVLSSSEYMD